MSIDPTKIDLLGHYVHPRTLEDICKDLERRRIFHLELNEEHRAKGERVWDDLSIFLHTSLECYHCGRNISIEWTGKDEDIPTLGIQFLRPDEWAESHRPIEVPQGTLCPVPDLLPATVRFTCKSGRIALGNDFRKYHTDQRQAARSISVNSHAGKDAYIKWYASHGYLTGFVGNTHVWFVPRDGGLDVVFPGCGGGRMNDEEWDRLDKTCIHDVSTELWWFAIVDAADLPEGATDSYDREVGFMDLEPGEYEAIIQPETSTTQVVATLRRVES